MTPNEPRYRITVGHDSFALAPGESLIGRDPVCQIQLRHNSVSRRHARIVVIEDVVTIEDLGSRNGTKVDGQLISAPATLKPGSQVTLGTRSLVLTDEPASPRGTVPEFEVEGEPTHSVSYQVPRMRTCASCRHPVDVSVPACPFCGAQQRTTTDYIMTLPVWTDPYARRKSRRVAVNLKGLYVSGTLTAECSIGDLSVAGAFVKTTVLDTLRTACDLLVFVSDDDMVRLSGTVVRVADTGLNQGMAIQFGNLGDSAMAWLGNLIAMIDARM